MFSRNGSGGPFEHQHHLHELRRQQEGLETGYLSASHHEVAGTGIGMSPIGLPPPADLSLPLAAFPQSATSAIPNVKGLDEAIAPSNNHTKPVSYASAAGGLASTSSSSSPAQRLRSPPNSASISGGLASPTPTPRTQQYVHANGITSHTGLLNTLSPDKTGTMSRLSASVPSAFPMEGPPSSFFHDPPSPGVHLSRAPHPHSPLAPSMQQSQSHSHTIPSFSVFNPLHVSSISPATGIGSMSSIGLGMPPSHRPASSTGVFGTSPFGKNAIFLSSSHEDEKDAYMSRVSRTPGGGRDMSPIGFEREGLRRGSYDSRSFPLVAAPDTHAAALQRQFEYDSDRVVEEELVPRSLKHLLTPDEKVRRSGGKTGTFNPFDDAEDLDDERDLQRYSQSVPASARTPATSTFSRAPGSPPIGTMLSSYMTPLEFQLNGTLGAPGSANSNLAKHLLGSHNGPHHPHPHAHPPPRIERGFYSSTSSSPAPQSTITNNLQPVFAGTSGTSLPQGLAAGLSRLHLIPAGQERTGYTPQNSYISSPPPGSPPTSTGGALVNPLGLQDRSTLASSYNMKLPTLASVRRVSGNQVGETNMQGHVGSPLAKSELSSHVTRPLQNNAASHQAKSNNHTPPHEREDEELLFDMDV